VIIHFKSCAYVGEPLCQEVVNHLLIALVECFQKDVRLLALLSLTFLHFEVPEEEQVEILYQLVQLGLRFLILGSFQNFDGLLKHLSDLFVPVFVLREIPILVLLIDLKLLLLPPLVSDGLCDVPLELVADLVNLAVQHVDVVLPQLPETSVQVSCVKGLKVMLCKLLLSLLRVS
jgi:hypothetical protein